jgi:hypothetical protein
MWKWIKKINVGYLKTSKSKQQHNIIQQKYLTLTFQ